MDSRHSRPLPEAIHLPEPSWQPILLAFGVMLISVGVIWTLVISVIGLLLVIVAIAAWTQENRLAAPPEEDNEDE